MIIPRIRARVGTGEDNKFYFELSIWNFVGTEMLGGPFVVGPFETEKQAHEEMLKATQTACEVIEKGMGQEPSGQYLDMKNGGQLRPWIEQ